MIEDPRPKEENIIKDVRNHFRLGKETKTIKDRILTDINSFFSIRK